LIPKVDLTVIYSKLKAVKLSMAILALPSSLSQT
jgi:hypothetical protein